MRTYKLKRDLPFLKKGSLFSFDEMTGEIFAILDDKQANFALRSGLSGYLWLLLTEHDLYLEQMSISDSPVPVPDSAF